MVFLVSHLIVLMGQVVLYKMVFAATLLKKETTLILLRNYAFGDGKAECLLCDVAKK